MIPLQLELTNFLSYREPTALDLDGIHLACIAGMNGAGKSSLLDAITWTLFGKCRARNDDDVVNRLAAARGEMAEVRFIFQLDNATYRIIRRKKVGRSAELEFQIDASEDGRQWKPLSEGRIRDTQAAIEQTLNMNYDIFTNASFLLQGKADEFTTKTPHQRKEILADLLGVSQWEQYRQAAATARKDVEEEQLHLDGRLSEIERELEEEAARKAALEEAQEAYQRASEELSVREQLLAQMRRAEEAIEQQRQSLLNIEESLAGEQERLESLYQTQAARQQERAAYQALLDVADTINSDFTAWQSVDAALRQWRERQDVYNALCEQMRPLELIITQERSRLEQRLEELTTRSQEVDDLLQERAQLAAALERTQEELERLDADLARLAECETEYHDARQKLQALKNERQLHEQEAGQLRKRAAEVEKQLREREMAAAHLAEAEAAIERLSLRAEAAAEQRQALATLREERSKLEGAQPRLKETMQVIAERIATLREGTAEECPLCGQALSEAHRRQVIADQEAEGKKLGDEFRANKSRIAELDREIERLEKAQQQNGQVEHDRQLQQQRRANAEARLSQIAEAEKQWKEDGAKRLAELERLLADDRAIRTQDQWVIQLAAAVEPKPSLEKARYDQQRRLVMMQERLSHAEQIIGKWQTEGEAAWVAVREALEARSYAAQEQASLAALEAEAEALGYDAAAHEAVRQRAEALAEAPARYNELKQAEAAVKPLEAALADLAAEIERGIGNVARLTRQRDEVAAHLEALQANGGDVEAVEEMVNRLREEALALNRRVGAAQQRLEVLDDLRGQRKRYLAERAEVSQRIQRLRLLEKACGRDGVQALLIENALPEIEESANELLERLSDGKMHIQFKTQRQLKTRDALAETLDIHIHDEAGERPYESFSGGEQFRVNFAVRLALSKVLAHRAGARLQTLIIDEGFGSQDPAGRQRLVEAINMIREDFARILVITHIDELRDAFPTRIQVEKSLQGSVVAIY